MSLKTENSRRVAKSRPVCMSLKARRTRELLAELTAKGGLAQQVALVCG